MEKDIKINKTPSWAAATAAKSAHLADPNDRAKRLAYTKLMRTCIGESGLMPPYVDRQRRSS
jgi:hypothetical protein